MSKTEKKLEKGNGSDASTCSAYRVLEDDELPKQGDEAWRMGRWWKVEIPSMWLAGGQRIEGSIFRRPMKYLIFEFSSHYPRGGMSDFVKAVETLEEALKYARGDTRDNVEIYNRDTLELVWEK